MNELTIGDLEDLTGVPRRTIYFYVQQSILPPPSGAGLAARYHRSHLLRLRAIPRLRTLGWRLDRIREFFERASDDQIAAVVEGTESPVVDAAAMMEAPPRAPAASSAPPALFARYRLAPGVDLFVQQDLRPGPAAAVVRLLDAAATIFGRSDQDSQAAVDQDGVPPDQADSDASQKLVDGRSKEDAR
jgi:DNA-binding transcriptional MerR regulator